MKKKIMLSIGVLAIAVIVSLNINLAKTDLSSLAFMNIQALAGESGGSSEQGVNYPTNDKFASFTLACWKNGAETSNKQVTCTSPGLVKECTPKKCS